MSVSTQVYNAAGLDATTATNAANVMTFFDLSPFFFLLFLPFFSLSPYPFLLCYTSQDPENTQVYEF